jgi:hypothetical protein
MFAIADAQEISEKRIEIPLRALGAAQLTTIGDAFVEADWPWATAESLVKSSLLPAINAVNIAYLFYLGRLVDSRQCRDCDTQLEALKIAAKIHKLFAREYDNIHFATHRDIAFLISAARPKMKLVRIVRPTQLVQLR